MTSACWSTGDDGLGQLLVVVVGVDVDEIDDAGARLLGTAAWSRPRRAARRVNEVRRTRGSSRWRDTPSSRSSSQRAERRDSRKLVTIGNRLPSRAQNSIREKIQSLGGRPWFST